MRGQPVILTSSRLRSGVSIGLEGGPDLFLDSGAHVGAHQIAARLGEPVGVAVPEADKLLPGRIFPPRPPLSSGLPTAVTAQRFQAGLSGNRWAKPESHISWGWVASSR